MWHSSCFPCFKCPSSLDYYRQASQKAQEQYRRLLLPVVPSSELPQPDSLQQARPGSSQDTLEALFRPVASCLSTEPPSLVQHCSRKVVKRLQRALQPAVLPPADCPATRSGRVANFNSVAAWRSLCTADSLIEPQELEAPLLPSRLAYLTPCQAGQEAEGRADVLDFWEPVPVPPEASTPSHHEQVMALVSMAPLENPSASQTKASDLLLRTMTATLAQGVTAAEQWQPIELEMPIMRPNSWQATQLVFAVPDFEELVKHVASVTTVGQPVMPAQEMCLIDVDEHEQQHLHSAFEADGCKPDGRRAAACVLRMIAAQEVVPRQQQAGHVQPLEAPILPPATPATFARTSTCLEMLAELPAAAPPCAASLQWSVAGGVNFIDLIAPDMMLDDTLRTLPPVLFDDESAADQAESDIDSFGHMLTECGVKKQVVAHLNLHLDWSLMDPTARSAAQRPAAVHLLSCLHPKPLPVPTEPLRDGKATPSSQVLRSLSSLFGENGPAEHDVEELPSLIRRKLQQAAQHARPAGAARKTAPALGQAPASAATSSASKRTAGLQEPQQTRALVQAQSGVFQGRGRLSSSGPAAKPPSAPATDMAFFLGLQRGSAGAAQAHAEPAEPAAPAAPDSPASCDSAPAEEPDIAEAQTEMQYHRTTLPARHRSLLEAIQEDHDRLASSTNGVSPAVAASPLDQMAGLEEALQEAATAEKALPGSHKALLKAYAAMAVLRQTARMLLQCGILCAHLYLQQMIQAVPALRSTCMACGPALKAAYAEVEAGKLEDHPKQRQLRQLLTSIKTLSPGGKILVVGEASAFFTMYKVINAVGLHAYQLDRQGQLQASGLQASAVAQAVTDALAAADCLLVTHEHLSVTGFPMDSFASVIEYVQQPDSGVPGAAAQASAQAACVHHAFVDEMPDLKSSSAPQHAAKRLRTSAPLPQSANVQRQVPHACSTTPTAAPVMPSGAPKAALSAPSDRAANDNVAGEGPPQEHALVISSLKDSLLQSRRSMYEAVLQLERQGAVIVERPLRGVDMALTCDTFLHIWKESSLMGGELATVLRDHVGGQLKHAGCAYAKALLCFEGSNAFCYQLADCIEQVHAAAVQAGVQVQVFTSTSPVITQDIVTKAAQAILADLRKCGAPPVELSEQQTPHERFLNAIPCLNPLSAARLVTVNLTLGQLVTLSAEGQQQLAAAVPDVPPRSLKLLYGMLSWGERGPGLLGAQDGVGHPQPQQLDQEPRLPWQADDLASFQPQHAQSWQSEQLHVPLQQPAQQQQHAPGYARQHAGMYTAQYQDAPMVYRESGVLCSDPEGMLDLDADMLAEEDAAWDYAADGTDAQPQGYVTMQSPGLIRECHTQHDGGADQMHTLDGQQPQRQLPGGYMQDHDARGHGWQSTLERSMPAQHSVRQGGRYPQQEQYAATLAETPGYTPEQARWSAQQHGPRRPLADAGPYAGAYTPQRGVFNAGVEADAYGMQTAQMPMEPSRDSQGDAFLDFNFDDDDDGAAPVRGPARPGPRYGLDAIIPEDSLQHRQPPLRQHSQQGPPAMQTLDPEHILDDFRQKRRAQGSQGTFKRAKLQPATGVAANGNQPAPARTGSRKAEFLEGLGYSRQHAALSRQQQRNTAQRARPAQAEGPPPPAYPGRQALVTMDPVGDPYSQGDPFSSDIDFADTLDPGPAWPSMGLGSRGFGPGAGGLGAELDNSLLSTPRPAGRRLRDTVPDDLRSSKTLAYSRPAAGSKQCKLVWLQECTPSRQATPLAGGGWLTPAKRSSSRAWM